VNGSDSVLGVGLWSDLIFVGCRFSSDGQILPLSFAFSYFSWGIPYYSPSLVLEKVEILPLENQYFSTFQIPREPC